MSYFPPKFPECRDCKFFRPETGSVRCLPCGAGEYFEEKIEDRQPNVDELMEMFKNMTGAHEDD